MFGTTIKWTVHVLDICRFCNRNSHRTENYKKLCPQLLTNCKRNINSSMLHFCRQQPAIKPKETNNQEDITINDSTDEKTMKENNKNKEITDEKNINNTNLEKYKDETELARESEDKKSREKRRRTREQYSKFYRQEKNEIIFDGLITLHQLEHAPNKDKETYLEYIRRYQNTPKKTVDIVYFLYCALKLMKDFGVEKDMEVYKELLHVFPKFKMVATNQFQAMFIHYPKEQVCALTILEQMEDNAIIPDAETFEIIRNTFGNHSKPMGKACKMLYWMPKFKHLNPWPVPTPVTDDPFKLANYAMHKISSIDVASKITVFHTKDVKDSIDDVWIVSAMAPEQQELLLKHDKKVPIRVEGPFTVYVATKPVDHFVLRADLPKDKKFPNYDLDDVSMIRNPYTEIKTPDIIPPPSIHEEYDGTIFAVCATETSSKDSLLSWIRCLEKENPVLAEIPIVFSFRSRPESELKAIEEHKKRETEAAKAKLLQ